MSTFLKCVFAVLYISLMFILQKHKIFAKLIILKASKICFLYVIKYTACQTMFQVKFLGINELCKCQYFV
jgi:hypothetical protein